MQAWGLLHREGNGVQQDWATALRWYSRGAELGDPEAQNNLGTMFLEGFGCQRDKAQAVYWYRKGAEQGNAVAQWNLGKRYLHGDGIDRNYAEAYQWFSKALMHHHTRASTEACYEMGTMHRFGQGVPRNLLAAADFHIIAAGEGDSVACGNISEYRTELQDMALSGSQRASLFLCRIYNRGFGVERSQPLAWTWILWAKKYCSPDPDVEIAEEVSEAYEFCRQCITSANRKAGKQALAALRAAQCTQADRAAGHKKDDTPPALCPAR
jgi:TPR repeat protein